MSDGITFCQNITINLSRIVGFFNKFVVDLS